MKSVLRSLTFALCACAGMSGCMTLVDVKPYTGQGQAGFRYALPEPYLLVKPKNDGTASYEWVYLPNQDNEYSVNAQSFLSSYKLTLTSDNGFLKTANFTGTSTAAVSKTADLIGEVLGAKKDTEVAAAKTADKAATEKATADAKAASDKLAAAEKALSDSQAAQIAAQAEVDFYASPAGQGATPAAVLAAKLALAKAQANEQEMQRRRDTVVASSAGAQDTGATPALQQAWGPMLFRVVQKDGWVELRAVNTQVLVQTSGSPPKTAAKAFEDVTFGTPKVSAAAGSTTVSFLSSASVTLIDGPVQMNKGNDAYTPGKLTFSKQGEKAFTVTFTPQLPAGEYTVMVPFKPASGADSASALKFTVP